jgi:hypothetical protein
MTIHEAHKLLKGKKLSSVELTRAYLERVRQVEPKVRALVTVTEEMALQQAQRADEQIALNRMNPLTGIPAPKKSGDSETLRGDANVENFRFCVVGDANNPGMHDSNKLRQMTRVFGGVIQEANDVQQLKLILETLERTLEAAGIEERPRTVLADAGYWSEANVTACCHPEGTQWLITTTKVWRQRKALRERGCPRGRIPKRLSLRERMERKLLTQRGRALYKVRGVLVEPVLGQVKEGQSFRRFMRRGLRAAHSEWSLMGTTHNLLKLWRSGQAPWGWANARWN